MKLAARIVAFLAALPLVSGCALNTYSDPFAGSASSGGGGRNRPAVRVTLEVVCDQCIIQFSFGGEVRTASPDRTDQAWSTRVVRYPITSETVRLSATATEDPVRSVRIFVNGDLVAEDENVDQDRLTLCASTLIPPPEEPSSVREEGCGGMGREGHVSL